jgi:hypothetical protein
MLDYEMDDVDRGDGDEKQIHLKDWNLKNLLGL